MADNEEQPKKDRPMTLKERKFVNKYIETGDAKAAADYAYDTNNPMQMAFNVKKRPKVQREIERIMEKVGLTDELIINRLKDGVMEEDPKAYLQAVKIAKDIRGLDAPKNHNVDQTGEVTVRWAGPARQVVELEEPEEDES